MWRVDLSQPVCSTCSPAVPVPFLLYDAFVGSPAPVQPIFYDAGIIFISGGAPPTLGVAFGTGNRSDLVASNGTQTNRFIFVEDPGGTKTFHATDLVDLTPGCSVPCGPGTPTSNGYFLDFSTHDEKTVSTVFSTLGNLSLLTYDPNTANPCDPQGQSFRYEFSFATGKGAYTTTPTGTYADFRQSLGSGLANAAQGQSSNGDIIDWALMQSGDVNIQTTPGSLKTISQSWKEQ
jgi:hypothetical protein